MKNKITRILVTPFNSVCCNVIFNLLFLRDILHSYILPS